MSSESVFPTNAEEISNLVEELRRLRSELRDLSAKAGRIEKRVYHAFPAFAPKPAGIKSKSRARMPSISPDQAIAIFNDLTELARSGRESDALAKIEHMEEADLRIMTQELGVSLGKKRSSRKAFGEAIVGRIRESIMLSRHTSRPQNEGPNTAPTDPPIKNTTTD